MTPERQRIRELRRDLRAVKRLLDQLRNEPPPDPTQDFRDALRRELDEANKADPVTATVG